MDLPTLGRPTIATIFDTENLDFNSCKDKRIIYLQSKYAEVKPRFLDTIQKAYANALVIDTELEEFKGVIFSDHHRGTGDNADDYRFAAATYDVALDHYLKKKHRLILLGDVEELWENSLDNVLKSYAEVMEKERAFHEFGYYRIWGNHDADWSSRRKVEKYLKPVKMAHEGLVIRMNDNGRFVGQLFLIHGHQGSLFSDQYARMGKFFVRYLWRPIQNISNKPVTTAATSTKMRSKHDERYYRWAAEHNHDLVVITGHSHEPVFNSFTYADRLRLASAHLSLLEVKDDLTIEQRVKLDEVRERLASIKQHDATHLNPDGHAIPCYFNTGCCSFADGGVTGIEIAAGEIRLVKWDKPGIRRVIHKARLRRIFQLLELNSTVESEGV